MQVGSRQITGWSELTDAEHYLLSEAVESAPSFVDLLNGWVSGPDAAYWNRKEPYVDQLIPAALGLLRAGLIQVRLSAGAAQTEVDPVTAERAVSDVANWWSYDPDDNWDPDEDLRRYAKYELLGTAPANALLGACRIDETELTRRLVRDEPPGQRRRHATAVTTFDVATKRALGAQARWAEAFRQMAAGGAGPARCPVHGDTELQAAWSARSEHLLPDGAFRVTGIWTLACSGCHATQQTLIAVAIRRPAAKGNDETENVVDPARPASTTEAGAADTAGSVDFAARRRHRPARERRALTEQDSSDHQPSLHREIRGWSDLTDPEHHVLSWADGHEFSSILRHWVSGPDRFRWNRLEPYARQVVSAATHLLEAGLIEVRLAPKNRVGWGLKLDSATAGRVVADLGNWWVYDPTAQGTTADDRRRYAKSELDPQPPPNTWGRYTLDATDAAQRLPKDEAPGVTRPLHPRTGTRYVAPGVVSDGQTRWAQAFRQLAQGLTDPIRCPDHDDADLAANWNATTEELPGDGTYTVAGVWTLTCPKCHAHQQASTVGTFTGPIIETASDLPR